MRFLRHKIYVIKFAELAVCAASSQILVEKMFLFDVQFLMRFKQKNWLRHIHILIDSSKLELTKGLITKSRKCAENWLISKQRSSS